MFFANICIKICKSNRWCIIFLKKGPKKAEMLVSALIGMCLCQLI